MIKNYPSLLFVPFVILFFFISKEVLGIKTSHKNSSNHFDKLKLHKTKYEQSHQILCDNTTTYVKLSERNAEFNSIASGALKQICEQYSLKIQNYLNGLDNADKLKLLSKIISENCQALELQTRLSRNKRFYHRFCIQFAKEQLAQLNLQLIAQQ